MRSHMRSQCEREAGSRKLEVGSGKMEVGRSIEEHIEGTWPQRSSMALLPSIIEECIEGTGRSGARWRCSTGIPRDPPSRNASRDYRRGARWRCSTGIGARWRCSTGIHHHRETISRQQCTRTPVLKANRHTMGARIPTYAHHGRMNPDVCTPWENESRRVHISRPGEERL